MSERIDVITPTGIRVHRAFVRSKVTLCGRKAVTDVDTTHDPAWWAKQPRCKRCDGTEAMFRRAATDEAEDRNIKALTSRS